MAHRDRRPTRDDRRTAPGRDRSPRPTDTRARRDPLSAARPSAGGRGRIASCNRTGRQGRLERRGSRHTRRGLAPAVSRRRREPPRPVPSGRLLDGPGRARRSRSRPTPAKEHPPAWRTRAGPRSAPQPSGELKGRHRRRRRNRTARAPPTGWARDPPVLRDRRRRARREAASASYPGIRATCPVACHAPSIRTEPGSVQRGAWAPGWR